MLTIDGSMGEGGGQVLRTSLAMSLVTGTPFRIERIRAGREKPGLLRQHLTAVNAAAAVGGAQVRGAAMGSEEVTFTPSGVFPGEHRFAVGTAGSATLVCQAVLPALLRAREPSRLVLEGGTHNPAAPPFDFLERALLPLVNRCGPRVSARLERRGFYPAGGGRFVVEVEPAREWRALSLLERGEVRSKRAVAIVSALGRHVGERELETIRRKLVGGAPWGRDAMRVEEEAEPRGPGNAVMIEVESEHATEVFTGFGSAQISAEAVATGAVEEARAYLAAGVPVGEHLADQLMVVLAVGAGGEYATLPLSRHATTNVEVIRAFTGEAITVEPMAVNGGVVVRVPGMVR